MDKHKYREINKKIARLWDWHYHLMDMLNDIRNAQNALNADCVGDNGFARLAQKVDALAIKANAIAEYLDNEIKQESETINKRAENKDFA